MKTPKLTRRYLLTQVKKLILEEPKRIRMEDVLRSVEGRNAPSCGTVGCIAGWTSIVAERARKKNLKEAVIAVYDDWGFVSPLVRARRLLRLSLRAEDRLFYLEGWPLDLYEDYHAATTPTARVTCKRIDLFLKSGGGSDAEATRGIQASEPASQGGHATSKSQAYVRALRHDSERKVHAEMKTKFIEATNIEAGGGNWGKFMVAQFDTEEWSRRSEIGLAFALRQRGWTPEHLLVLDLQTGEGAIFKIGGYAKDDLNKHRVWVCPMFEPFLEWLYEQNTDNLEALPSVVQINNPDTQLAGYRREGPEC